ncbi:MAG: DNA polymerase IV [Verrucomicrobiota bacterium]
MLKTKCKTLRDQAELMPASFLTILHVDMDAFYAAIEALDHPEWRGLPLVVGSPPDQRGVVATCSYEARRYGIHSAMPSRTAGKLCPQAVFVPPRMERYAEISARIMDILEEFTPLVEPLSLDEAFLDVSGTLRIWGDAVTIAAKLKERIKTRTGLTASVGVAPNKFLAKMASDMHKPDGLTVVPVTAPEIMAFLAPLPVTKMWGIGKVTGARMAKEGIRTIGQLQALNPGILERLFGKKGAADMADLARGRDNRPVITHWEEKSISNEYTFPYDEPDMERVRQRLLELAEEVGGRLRKSGKLAKTARIKLRFGDFATITRQTSFSTALNSDRELIACALALFECARVKRKIRLVGFGVSNLARLDQAAPAQPELFAALSGRGPDSRNKKIDQAVDALRHSFGSNAIRRGKI